MESTHELTLEQQATNFKTFRHIERVRNLLNVFVMRILCSDRNISELHKQESPTLVDFSMHFIHMVSRSSRQDIFHKIEDLSEAGQIRAIYANTAHDVPEELFEARRSDVTHWFVGQLLQRGEKHDQTKLEPPEVEFYTEYTPRLKEMEYGSEEYKQCLQELKPALDHHYAHNSHHPEFHKNGVNDMTLIDHKEMLVDWKASSERQHNGNILKSIESNTLRFKMCPSLVQLYEATAKQVLRDV